MAALDYLKARGLSARQAGNKLSVSPRSALTQESRHFIKLHRMELLAELAANDGEEQRTHWLVYRQGKQICVIAGGPMNKAEALHACKAHWPDAEVRSQVSVEAYSEESPQSERGSLPVVREVGGVT